MLKNSDFFFVRAKEYQDKRKAIVDSYEARLHALETMKGSKYFNDEQKRAEDTKEDALRALKAEYREYFRLCLDAMSKANASREMTPPTDEELHALQLLKMKDKVTEAELRAAANTLKGNPYCLSVLTEISYNAGYLRGYNNYSDNKEMTAETADDIIKGLASSVRDFMEYDTPRAARIAQQHNEIYYGKTSDAPALPKRRLFEDKAACYSELCGLSGDSLEAFENAIDK